MALIYAANQKAKLAPFYDLVCTRAIEHIDAKLAMSISGEFNPDKINLSHWDEFAKNCGVRQKYLYKLLQEMAENLMLKVKEVRQKFENKYGAYPALDRVEKIVMRQCKKLLRYTV